jgi:hypothetical protein
VASVTQRLELAHQGGSSYLSPSRGGKGKGGRGKGAGGRRPHEHAPTHERRRRQGPPQVVAMHGMSCCCAKCR